MRRADMHGVSGLGGDTTIANCRADQTRKGETRPDPRARSEKSPP
jgi:hypothetical protein